MIRRIPGPFISRFLSDASAGSGGSAIRGWSSRWRDRRTESRTRPRRVMQSRPRRSACADRSWPRSRPGNGRRRLRRPRVLAQVPVKAGMRGHDLGRHAEPVRAGCDDRPAVAALRDAGEPTSGRSRRPGLPEARFLRRPCDRGCETPELRTVKRISWFHRFTVRQHRTTVRRCGCDQAARRMPGMRTGTRSAAWPGQCGLSIWSLMVRPAACR
jgi:hypothetical protein